MLNYYEESRIANAKLPNEWQSQGALDGLAEFLQQNWEQRSIFYDDGQVTSRQQFLEFCGQMNLRTKNYIGTIVYKGQQLNIYPKMFRTAKDNNELDNLDLSHLMLNIVKWIEYCTKIDYPYINISSELDDSANLWELFVTLYVRYVKSAIDKGIYYCYEERNEDCPTLKGRVDFKDYFTRKYSSGNIDKFLCCYSMFELDNKLNRIIKYTCKGLINKASKANQRIIRRILAKLSDVSDFRCSPHDCDAVKLNGLDKRYSVILSMSKIFLLNKSSTYNLNNTESFCFLFPTELLFEGFIGGFISSTLAGEARVRLQASDLYLFDNVRFGGELLGKTMLMKHDILVEHKDKGVFIFDTKYKMIDRFDTGDNVRMTIKSEVSQTDIYQVITYARTRKLKDVYLLYPMFRYEELGGQEVVGINCTVDKLDAINIHFIRVPFVFENGSNKTIDELKKTIQSIFSDNIAV